MAGFTGGGMAEYSQNGPPLATPPRACRAFAVVRPESMEWVSHAVRLMGLRMIAVQALSVPQNRYTWHGAGPDQQ